MQIDPDGAATTREWTPELGSQHPAGHGPITFVLALDGDGDDAIITWAEPRLIPLHRGVEKLFESRDYRQALMLADRHEWHSAFGSELGLALTIESMSGITVPPRAVWLRTAMAELSRAIHHLRWVGETIGELDREAAEGVALRDVARRSREDLTQCHEAISGGRLHPMLVVPGGVREDTPAGWTDLLRENASTATASIESLRAWVNSNDQLGGIGVLTRADAVEFGVTGPVGRASGASLDLRFDDSSLAYAELVDAGVLRRVTRESGDARARMEVLVDELAVSLDCVTAAADRLEAAENSGPINVRLPRAVRVPEGSGYGWTENPSGVNGWHLTSRGGPMPYRLKIRSASFANAQAMCEAVIGDRLTTLPTTLMTFLLVGGDLGK
ncbi:MAG: hypothetical protein WC054_08490 [Candidatus Nanopelagicales bacterium]